mgnify:CR=1 FL=1
MSLTITASTPLVIDRLQQIANRIGDLSKPLAAIGMEMESRISARFESQSDPLGQKWAAWLPSTRKAYPKDGHGSILDRYGDMLASLSHQADGKSVTIGFGQPHAAYHEWGTKHMARRGLLFADPNAGTLAPGDEAAILDILDRFLEQAVG